MSEKGGRKMVTRGSKKAPALSPSTQTDGDATSLHTMAPSFGGARSVATTIPVPSELPSITEGIHDGSRSADSMIESNQFQQRRRPMRTRSSCSCCSAPVADEISARRQRVDLIGERLVANNIQPALSVSSAPTITTPLPPVINETSASNEDFPTTSAKTKPKARGRPGVGRKDLPNIDDRLHKKKGTGVKKMKMKMRPEANRESSPENDSEDSESMEVLQCKWGACREMFNSKKALIKHFGSVHLDKTDKEKRSCEWDDCSRKTPFAAYYQLEIHARQHTGEKPFKCSTCTKRCTRKENLVTHERSHTGEKPYKCKEAKCEKAFSNANDRAKHLKRTHLNVRKYECGYQRCSKGYLDPSSLRKHVKTKHPEKMYEQMKLSSKRNVQGNLTAEAEMRETAELQAIESGVPARREDNHIYRNANFAPLYEQTGLTQVDGYEEVEEGSFANPRNETETRIMTRSTVMRPPPPQPQIINYNPYEGHTPLGNVYSMDNVGGMQTVPVIPIQTTLIQIQPFNEYEEMEQIARSTGNLGINDRNMQQRFESHWVPLPSTPSPQPMMAFVPLVTENDLFRRQIEAETPPMLNEQNPEVGNMEPENEGENGGERNRPPENEFLFESYYNNAEDAEEANEQSTSSQRSDGERKKSIR